MPTLGHSKKHKDHPPNLRTLERGIVHRSEVSYMSDLDATPTYFHLTDDFAKLDVAEQGDRARDETQLGVRHSLSYIPFNSRDSVSWSLRQNFYATEKLTDESNA